jgi:hypothetical protein
MKKLTLLAAATLLSATASQAATYTITNSSGPVNTQSIVTSSGAFANSGTVVIGTYLGTAPTLSTATSTMEDILDGFTTVATGSLGTSGSGVTTIHGVFSIQTSGTDPLDDLTAPAAAAWVGKNFFAIIGNGATIEESTEVLIFRFTNYTIPNTESTILTLNMRPADANSGGSVYGGFGGVGNYLLDPSPGNAGTANSTFNMVAVVPEPSAALLGMIGALGLLRRRR